MRIHGSTATSNLEAPPFVKSTSGSELNFTPPFHEFVIDQLHVGTFFPPNVPHKGGTFLDVARKLPYLAELGVTALQLLPIQEFQTSSVSDTTVPTTFPGMELR